MNRCREAQRVATTAEKTAGRKRAAVELIARDGGALRKTALRFSLCAEDAEDAYQRAMEILLLKAPSERPRELARWTQTVVKHEALAIRANRERLLGKPSDEGVPADRLALIPASGDGPDVRTERRERIARSREALQALKPAELRALTLLAAGYTYAEIGELTGFSQTKVNRCLAEGRERFRRIVAGSEDGSRCTELAPLLSAFCDGEAGPREEAAVREHLRACAACRATMRSYRTAPATVAALAPALPASRSLLERGQDLLAGLYARLPGAGGAAESSVGQVAAAGGTRGAGMAALATLLAVCAGTVGGAAACVATGVVPAPLDLTPDRPAPKVEPASERTAAEAAPPAVEYQPAPEPSPQPKPEPKHRGEQATAPAGEAGPAASGASAGAVEYSPPPAPTAPAAAPGSASSSSSSGSAAGEFGP
jgi:RNA polymerase sigma factor (sigma-70 family)